MADDEKQVIVTIFDAPGDDEQEPEGEDGCVMGCKCRDCQGGDVSNG